MLDSPIHPADTPLPVPLCIFNCTQAVGDVTMLYYEAETEAAGVVSGRRTWQVSRVERRTEGEIGGREDEEV